MPLLAINVSDKLFFQVKELVEGGTYQSFETFLEVAAYNQLALERGASPAAVIAQGHRHIRDGDGQDGASNGARSRSAKTDGKKGKRHKRAQREPTHGGSD